MLPLITLLTDFGLADTYVAQMKGVIYSLLPHARIVDITHEIEPQDIVGGALALADAAPFFPPDTIHVAVVDPGVGTERRILCAEINKQAFVLPDNGLLGLVLERFPLTRAHEVTQCALWRAEYSRTFHGRDIMAPVAAHLALGTSMAQVGPRTESILRLDLPSPEITGNTVRGMIIAIDRFGNAILNVVEAKSPKILTEAKLVVQVRERKFCAIFASTYGDHLPGETLILVGSQGRWEIATVNGHAARKLGIQKGDEFLIEY